MSTESNKRIHELEAQVERLTGMVSRLLEEREEHEKAQDPRKTSESGEEKKKLRAEPQPLVRQMRERVDHALGGDALEPLESRIGAIWLSRLAAVAIMTTLALAARTTLFSDIIGPNQKVLIGYGIAAAFALYGIVSGRRGDFFAEALLGCGLAGVYFVTYAAFFIEQTRVTWPVLPWGWDVALVLLSLVFLIAVAHWRRSQTVAGIGLFLAYYTVAVSALQAPTVQNMAHALITCAILAAAVFCFHLAHRWLLLSWGALIATHLTYIVYFWRKPIGLDMPDDVYFWISNGFLAICFILFSLTCVVDARKTGEYRRTVAPMSGVNSAVFLVLTYLAIREHYPEQQWMFRLAVGTLFLIFAIFAETAGPRRNYLFQIFIAKTVILYTLTLQAFLSEHGEILLVAMAIECLALGLSYSRSGIVVFKALGLGLAIITFTGCLLSINMDGTLHLHDYDIPANWFSAAGAAFFFQITAWYYEKFVRRTKPEYRITSGQWFLADTALDLRGATMAIIHAAGGAFLLLTITIFELDNDPALPFILAGEGVIFAGMGLVLRTAQIEVASVLLGAAGHLCFYYMLSSGHPEFVNQGNFVLYTTFLALFTYVGAYAWERYLRRYRHPDQELLEHHVVAAVPYLAGTFLLAILLALRLEPLHRPAAQGALGAVLLLLGVLTRYPGIKASGVLALGAASAFFCRGLMDVEVPLAQNPDFPRFALLFLGTLVISERFFTLLQHQERRPSRLEDALRTLLAILLVSLGALGLYKWAPPSDFLLYLLSFGVLLILLGALFRESRYRWGALLLFAVILIHTFIYFRAMSGLYQVLTFGASAIVLLAVSWGYSMASRRRRKARKSAPSTDPPSNG